MVAMKIAASSAKDCKYFREHPSEHDHNHKGQYASGRGVCISCLSIAIRDGADAERKKILKEVEEILAAAGLEKIGLDVVKKLLQRAIEESQLSLKAVEKELRRRGIE